MKMSFRWMKDMIAKHREKRHKSREQNLPSVAGPGLRSPAAETADNTSLGTPTKANLDPHLHSDRPVELPEISPGRSAESNIQQPVPSRASESMDPPMRNEPKGTSESIETADNVSPGVAEDAITAKPPLTSTLPSITPEDCAAWQWNIAYDRLMDENPGLRERYELVISSYIADGGQPGVTSRRSSKIRSNSDYRDLDNYRQRRTLMDRCLETLLEEPDPSVVDSTESGSDVDRDVDSDMTSEAGGASEVGEYEARSLKEHLRVAVRRSQHASIAWVTSWLTLESLLFLSSPPDAAQLGAVALLAKMEWYIELSKLVFRDWYYGMNETSYRSNLDPQMDILVQLYKAILSYQINIVCRRGGTVEEPELPPTDLSEFKLFESDIRLSEEALAGYYGQELKAGLTQKLSQTAKLEKQGLKAFGANSEEDDITRLDRLLEGLEVVEQPNLDLVTNTNSAFDDLYKWAASTPQYKAWVAWGGNRNERVLWLDGEPGTGKTKLLEAAVQGLPEDEDYAGSTGPKKVAYCFCDSRRPRSGNALFTVKTLIYHIIKNQPDLQQHLESKYKTTGRRRFNDPNDFYAMSLLLFDLIGDEKFQSTYFVVDAIEELAADEDIDQPSPLDERRLSDIITLIARTVEYSAKVRWLVSLDSGRCGGKSTLVEENMHLRLVIDPDLEDVCRISHSYMASKINDIAEKAHYEENLRKKTIEKVHGAPSNFLWLNMALDIIKASSTPWNAPIIMDELKTKTPSIHSMYADREKNLEELRDHDKGYCRNALYSTAIAYRPLLRTEFEAIIAIPPEVDFELLLKNILSPFLELSNDELSEGRRVQFVHSSAKHFIRQRLQDNGLRKAHSKMTEACIEILMKRFNCSCNGRPTDKAVNPGNTLDNSLDYASIFWITHMWEVHEDDRESVNKDAVHILDNHPVEWLELLDSRNLLSKALAMMAKLILALTGKSRRSVIVDAQGIRQRILDVSGLFKAHQMSKTTSEVHERTDDNEESQVSPENTLLFYPSRTLLKKRLLPKYFPWLVGAPIIEPTNSDSLHVMEHPDWVRECAFSPDAQLVASASDDSHVRLWDVKTGKMQHVLESPDAGYITSLAISRSYRDGRALLAASTSDAIWVRELYTGKVVRVLKEIVGATEVAERTEKTEDKARDECESQDENLILMEEAKDRDEDEKSNKGVVEDQDEVDGTRQALDVRSISMTQNGTRLAAAAGSRLIVWDLLDFKATVWEDDKGDSDQPPLRCVRFSDDNRLLASSAGKVITIWDATTRSVMCRLGSVATFGNGASVGSASDTNSLKGEIPKKGIPGDEADMEAQAQTPQRESGHTSDIDGLSFSPGGRYLASGSDDMTARIWDVVTGTTLAVLQYHESYVNSVSFSADGTYLATGSSDQTIAIWKQQVQGSWSCNAAPNQPHRVLKGHARAVLSVAFSPQGSLLASSGTDGDVRLWDAQAGTAGGVANEEPAAPQLRDNEEEESSPGCGHEQEVKYVTISPNGETIASASYDGVICLWDGQTGFWRCTMEEKHEDKVNVLVFSRDSARLVSASVDCSALVWNVNLGSSGLIHRLKGHSDWIRGAAMSPDGRLVATASDDRTVRVWDISVAGEDTDLRRDVPSREFSGHQDWVFSVAFSPNGLQLASAGDDGQIMIWNLEGQGNKEQPDKVLRPSVALLTPLAIRALVYSADSKRVMAKRVYGTLLVWQPDAPKEEAYLLEVDDPREWTSVQICQDHPDVLLTNFGAWPFKLDQSALDNAEAREGLRLPQSDVPPSWAPVGISADGGWITWNNRKIILLPRELRPEPQCCCVWGHRVVIGCKSGQIMLFRFSEHASRKQLTRNGASYS